MNSSFDPSLKSIAWTEFLYLLISIKSSQGYLVVRMTGDKITNQFGG